MAVLAVEVQAIGTLEILMDIPVVPVTLLQLPRRKEIMAVTQQNQIQAVKSIAVVVAEEVELAPVQPLAVAEQAVQPLPQHTLAQEQVAVVVLLPMVAVVVQVTVVPVPQMEERQPLIPVLGVEVLTEPAL